MCATCGCSSGGTVRLLVADHTHDLGRDHPHPEYGYPGPAHSGHAHPGHEHPDHEHAGHEHASHEHAGHEHAPAGEVRSLQAPDGPRTIELQQKVLAKNDDLAADNRAWLAGRGILAINLMSSPGAGKTTLLEATMRGMA